MVARLLGARRAAAALAVVLAGSAAAAQPSSPLRVDPARLARASAGLQAQLRADPFTYFRFVNPEWGGRVCEAFRRELPSLPTAILQGDAHIGQYALTASRRGLDDFDDAARGPAVVDLVRFLGSVDLVARRRGWAADGERLFDRFMNGYARALSDPSYVPPDPAVVTRLRARPSRTREQLLSWGESLMQPMSEQQPADGVISLELLENLVRALRPEISPGYFRMKSIGWLHMGVGSALMRKVLVRVEGPTTSPADDVLLEAKELGRLEGVPCMQVPISGEAFRVISAAQQIGRLRHDILFVVPRREEAGPEVRDWWVRSWDETYAEVAVADIESADELAEMVEDVGAQLGASNLRDSIPALEAQLRRSELDGVRRLAPQIYATARRLTDDLLAGWQEMRKSP